MIRLILSRYLFSSVCDLTEIKWKTLPFINYKRNFLFNLISISIWENYWLNVGYHRVIIDRFHGGALNCISGLSWLWFQILYDRDGICLRTVLRTIQITPFKFDLFNYPNFLKKKNIQQLCAKSQLCLACAIVTAWKQIIN